MYKLISENRRCKVYNCEDKIKKVYTDSDSFENEKNVYRKLNGKSYIPELKEIDEVNKEILIENITAKDFSNYLKENKKIPTNFLKELKKIRLEFLENGFYEWGDFYKLEHIFISETGSKNEINIIVIDFDSISVIPENQIMDRKNDIISDFNKLNSNKDYFKKQFGIYNNDDIIDDFFNNKII